MNEVALHCGNHTELIGIYTETAKEKGSTEHPTILFINSGLLPSTGPFRLYVQLARHIAAKGFNSFRFDLSGIGESERNVNESSREQQQIQDIRDAMDSLESRYGTNRFVIMGICTGADNAHKVMVADQRVVGYVGVDGYFYRTKRFYINYFLQNIILGSLKRRLWKRKYAELNQWIEKSLQRVRVKGDEMPAAAGSVAMPYRWEVPPKSQTTKDYQVFINNGQHALCIFTASWPYNYQNQHADSFPELEMGDHIQVRYLENAPHVFPFAEDRKLLAGIMSAWLIERFSVSSTNSKH